MDLDLDDMARQVHELCGSRRLSDIYIDLERTRNVELTVNRILDGGFLEGTSRDPSLKAHVILDSDDELDFETHRSHGKTNQDTVQDTIQGTGSDKRPNTDDAQPDAIILSSDDEQPESAGQSSFNRWSSPPFHGMDSPSLFLDSRAGLSPSVSHIAIHNGHSLRSTSVESNPPFTGSDDMGSSEPPAKKLRTTREHVNEVELDLYAEQDTGSPDYLRTEISLDSPKRIRSQNNSNSQNDILHVSSSEGPVRSHDMDPTPLSGDASFHDPFASDNDSLPSLGDLISNIKPRQQNATLKPHHQRESLDASPSSSSVRPTTQRWKGKGRAFPQPSSSVPPLDFLKEWRDGFSSDDSDDNDDVAESTMSQKERKRREREMQKQDRLEQKLERARKRKEEQEAKKLEKERRKAEKEAEKEKKRLFEQANKLRMNREELLAEMVVVMNPEFAESPRGELLREVLTSKKAEVEVKDDQAYAIAWHRKCAAEWNEEQQSFVPFADSQVHIEEEKFALVFCDMIKLCDLVQSKQLNNTIDRVRESAGADKQLILMTEGLETYYRKKWLHTSQVFQRAVLDNIMPSESQAPQPKKKTTKKVTLATAAATGPTKAEMEEALTFLQMIKDVMLVPTANEADTVDVLVSLTSNVGNALYRNRNRRRVHGSSRGSTTPADTWFKMLQEVQLCTPPVAKSITSQYPSVQRLYRAYKTRDPASGADLLADLEVERSVIQSRDRVINKAMSKKIYTIFTSTNPKHMAV